jgi:hypothetical protein
MSSNNPATSYSGGPLHGTPTDLARASVAPRIFQTGPPNYYTQTAFMKQIDIQGNWTVDDGVSGGANALVTLKADVTKSREGVSTQTGLVIWNVNRGAGSMYRST